RISDERIDPWGMAVSPTHFEEQLQVLLRSRHPMPLTKFLFRFTAGTFPPHPVGITIYDCYADNLYAGKPRLLAADIPATVFLVTGYLDYAYEFWWDELARLVLLGRGPENLALLIDGQIKQFDFSAEPPARGSQKVNTAPTTR